MQLQLQLHNVRLRSGLRKEMLIPLATALLRDLCDLQIVSILNLVPSLCNHLLAGPAWRRLDNKWLRWLERCLEGVIELVFEW